MDALCDTLSDTVPMACGRLAIMIVFSKLYKTELVFWDAGNPDGPLMMAKGPQALTSYFICAANVPDTIIKNDGLLWTRDGGRTECFLETEEMVELLTRLGHPPAPAEADE